MVRPAGQETLRSGLTCRETPLFGRHGAVEPGESQQAEKTTGRHGGFLWTVIGCVPTVNRHLVPSTVLTPSAPLSDSRTDSNLAISIAPRCQQRPERKLPPVPQRTANERRDCRDGRARRAIRAPQRLRSSQSEEDIWKRCVSCLILRPRAAESS